jgi:hypothetical protein
MRKVYNTESARLTVEMLYHQKSMDGAGRSVVIEALCYKPEGRGLETR